ncbi:MAG TPA: LytTR family DNA-binding domain-containing protein [Mucilaginibacter sp.]|nr:LytTR family DNA-binding domain-containing protein [Mucilaginibacter sp.]
MQADNESSSQDTSYNDLFLRIIISLIAGHIIVVFGEDDSFFQLLLNWDYYRSVLLSALIAFLLVSLINRITVLLDRKFDWKSKPIERTGLQLLLGFVTPGIIAFLLAAIYFKCFGINILKTVYLKYDYPVILMFVFAFNLYYVGFYFYRQMKYWESQPIQTPRHSSLTDIYMVTRGTKNIPLKKEEIVYFYHEGDYNFVRNRQGEDFLISETLEQVQELLDPKQFFRVNRQMIVHFDACLHFELLSYGKLKLLVKPAFKESIIISQKRAGSFKSWIEQRN